MTARNYPGQSRSDPVVLHQEKSVRMLLVAIAWIYVVVMMALVEAFSPNGTVLGALITLVLYGVLPLGIVLYLMSAPARRKVRHLREAQAGAALPASPDLSGSPAGLDTSAGSAAPVASANLGTAGDGRQHAAGAAVAAERKET
jgi:predicted membrane channel-forming protein YqfA (hemolysin III family)